MNARGMSTRDVEDAFRDATGEFLLSHSAVSEITDRLWEQYEEFCQRDLSAVACSMQAKTATRVATAVS
ncbi:MAG: transposase [Acidimicrobiia bacterium]